MVSFGAIVTWNDSVNAGGPPPFAAIVIRTAVDALAGAGVDYARPSFTVSSGQQENFVEPASAKNTPLQIL